MKTEDLKNSILQLAMQGKLVPQDSNDEPATVLLENIKKEKEQLIKAKKIKKNNKASIIYKEDGHYYEQIGKKEPLCIDDELPFDIPDSWEWVRLESIVKISTGNKDANHGTDDGEYVFFTCSKEQIKSPTYSYDGECLLLPGNGANVGLVLYYNGKFEVYQRTYVIEKIYDEFNICFLKMAMDLSWKKYNSDKMYGSAIPYIKLGNLKNYLVPLPPLNEQKRIVFKVKEFFPLIDEYGGAEEQLSKLNSELPKKLKDSILQEAVQGKLVSQDPNDEPASVLLTKIKQEKEQLIKAKKIKKNNKEAVIYKEDGHYYEKIGKKGEPVCIDDEIPFEIPDSWEWCRLNSLCEYIQRGKSPKYSPIKKYPVVAQKCNQWDGFSLEKAKFIEPDTVDSYNEERILQNDDLMWNSTGLGTLGRIGLYDETVNEYGWAVADSHITVIRPFKKSVLPQYIYDYLAGPSVQSVIESKASGTTKQKELNLSTVKEYLIPLPPLNEQKRIVDKVEQLFDNVNVLIDE